MGKPPYYLREWQGFDPNTENMEQCRVQRFNKAKCTTKRVLKKQEKYFQKVLRVTKDQEHGTNWNTDNIPDKRRTTRHNSTVHNTTIQDNDPTRHKENTKTKYTSKRELTRGR